MSTTTKEIETIINKKISLLSWNYLLNFFEEFKSELSINEIEILNAHSEKCRHFLNTKYEKTYGWKHISKKDMRVDILYYLKERKKKRL